MTTKLHRESARIYAFPVGGRAGLSGRYAVAEPVRKRTTDRAEEAALGDNWYHEAALLEPEPARKR